MSEDMTLEQLLQLMENALQDVVEKINEEKKNENTNNDKRQPR